MTFIRRKVKRLKTEKTVNKLGVASVAIAATQLAPLAATNVAHAVSYSQQSFINQVGSVARQVANDNDLYASVMIAQAILESNWGNSGLSRNANNLFGIKGAYNGQSVTMRTAEQRPDGSVYYLNEPFRKYPTIKESMLDYVALVKGSRFYAGAWKSNTTSYQQATKHLTGRYATAINYNTVLNNIITTYNLTQFDTPNTNSKGNIVSPAPNVANDTYVVKSGDSVWAIAMRFNMTMNEVISLNNIKNNFIYPGQVLKVRGQSANPTVKSNANVTTTQSITQTATPQQTNYYTVVSGDSVWVIAMRFNMTMNEVISLNNIRNNFIYPGQVLKVRGQSANPTVKSNTNVTTTQSVTRTATPQQTNYYTVVSGDSVWGIANKYGMSMDTLVSLNGIKNYFIYPGQRLVVSTTQKTAQTQSVHAQTYTVKPGDSVWLIANKYGITMNQLRQVNNIRNNFIYPGQQIVIK